MSAAAKQSIVILVILLLAAFGFAGNTYLQKQQLEKAKVDLEKQVSDYQEREIAYITEQKVLEEKLSSLELSKAELEEKVNSFDMNVGDLDEKVKRISKERDEWKKRVMLLREERNGLLTKMQEAASPDDRYNFNNKESVSFNQLDDLASQTTASLSNQSMTSPIIIDNLDDESYWAQVLREKVALELQVESLKTILSTNSLEVEDLKKQNGDLQLEISQLTTEIIQIERDIKNGSDLSDILALQLTRAQNDKRFLKDQVDKIKDENITLQAHIKNLTTTKLALERSVVDMQNAKKDVEKKLFETENIIQSRIDEIWEIKDSIDKTFQPTKVSSADNGQIELPPIVVNSQDASTIATRAEVDLNVFSGPGFDGNIVSVNEENNFVIVDLGEKSGIKLGDSLNVYRGADFVAGIEVIQVRKDIAAADITNKVTQVQIGDAVR